MDNNAIIAGGPAAPHGDDSSHPPSSSLLSQVQEIGIEDRPTPLPPQPPPAPPVSNNNNEEGNKRKSKRRTWFQMDHSVMPENADPDEWNWFTSLRTGIEESNKELKSKIEKSNKAIEEKFYEGLDAVTNAPGRAVDTIREKHNMRIELKEKHESEHWKHERKLLTKFESLDYTTIYNKSYRTELYQKFFDITGEYEWLRWILSFFIAAFIGFIAWIAKVAINGITEAKFSYAEKAIDVHLGVGFVVFFVSNVILAVLGSLVAVYWEPTAAGSGIPEVKAYLNGTKVPRFLRMKTLFAKVLSMVLANAASLQVGAEGPMIHVGAIVGNGVSQAQSKELGFKIPYMRYFRNDRDKRDFITSGAGAGVAAAFGAPLGGTLFSLEEVSSFWSTRLTWRTFFTCMVAVFIMKLLLVIQSGKYFDSGFMIFNIGTTTAYEIRELIPFLGIGVIGGLLGGGFTAFNLWVTELRAAKINKERKWRVLEVLAIVAVSSCLQFLLPFLSNCKAVPGASTGSTSVSASTSSTAVGTDYGLALTRHYCAEGQYNQLASIIFNSNEHTINNLFASGENTAEYLDILDVFIFFLFYTFGAAYTAGCGLSSGMFVPMIVIGSAYGRIVGMGIHSLYGSSIDPGIYAVMGAAAFMAGVSRLTVSLTVIIIEITNDLANLLPIMLVVMTAKIVADFIIHPLFDKQIEMKHIPYLEPTPVKEMKILMCKHIMAKHPKCLTERENIGNILMVLKNTVHNGFPIVNNQRDKLLKGLILRPQLLVLLDRMSKIWVSRADLVYSHQEYMTKLAWNLPKLQDILDAYEEEDYGREIDLTPYMNITVYSVNEEFAASEAFVMFRTLGLRHLPVVNVHNKVKGMITKKDLLEHSCIEKYKELKRLKKMNIDLPEDMEMDSTPGTPMERDTHHSASLADSLRKRLTPLGTSPVRSPSSSLHNSQIIYSPPPANPPSASASASASTSDAQ